MSGSLTEAYLRDLSEALGVQVEGTRHAEREARKEGARTALERALDRAQQSNQQTSNERDQTEG